MKRKKNNGNRWYRKLVKNMHVKENISDAKEKFSCFLELPREVVSKSTKLTSIENNNVLIEGYRQIIDYYDDFVFDQLSGKDIRAYIHRSYDEINGKDFHSNLVNESTDEIDEIIDSIAKWQEEHPHDNRRNEDDLPF